MTHIGMFAVLVFVRLVQCQLLQQLPVSRRRMAGKALEAMLARRVLDSLVNFQSVTED